MTRNAEQNQRIRDERREAILSSALRLFAAKGFFATKITDIAAEAGISQGLLYHYFRSKEEVIVELIREAFEKMNAATRVLEGLPLSPAEKIRKATTDLLYLLETGEEFAQRVLVNVKASTSEAIPEEAKAIIREEGRLVYDAIARIMAAGQEDGSIAKHDPQELSLVFWTTIKGLAVHKAAEGDAFRSPDPKILTSMFLTEKCNE